MSLFSFPFWEKAVSHSFHLRGHIEAVHEGKKPFQCNICDASFSHKGHMNSHIERFHKQGNLVSGIDNKTVRS